uniref:Peptidase_M13 domain-containing protein n=1 Tax=Trichobilharzia regenti TaxID=157069 RepID=A0AA85JBN6_TRIRE|nr:unnamed protein product [Trichobilharzia regenti]
MAKNILCVLYFIIQAFTIFSKPIEAALPVTTPTPTTNTTEEQVEEETTTAISVKQSYNLTNASSPTDPCNDFYQYACSDWENNHTIPKGELGITRKSEIQNYVRRDIWKIIANGSYSTNDTRLNTVRKFYKSCVEYGNISLQETRRQTTRLIERLFGGWDLLSSSSQNLSETSTPQQGVDDFNLDDIYFPILSITKGCPLFSIDINGGTQTIHISGGRFASYKGACEKQVYAENIAPKYYENAYKLGVSPTEESKLQAAFESHTRLCHNLYVARKSDKTAYYKQVKMRELNTICPLMNWKKLFERLFRQIGFKNYKTFKISIADTTALKYHCALHEIELSTPTGKSTIKNMAIMDFMTYHVNTIGLEVNSSESANSEMDSGLSPKFSVFCIEQLKETFPWTLERHYVAQYFKESQRNEVFNMVDEIKKTVNDSFEKLTWLNDGMKRFVIDKLQYPIDENTYIMNEYYARRAKVLDDYRKEVFGLGEKLNAQRATYIPSASYWPTENRININGALLNLPINRDNQTISEKYGGLGWHIAHEILHAVDTSCILIDENGNDRPPNIARNEFLALLKQTECLRKQYTNYDYTSEKSGTIPVLDEILSDNGGLRIAYQTFQRLTRNLTNDAGENTNSSSTSEKSFFYNFAQTFCEKYTAEGITEDMSNSDHVLGHYRVVGALSNSENFARAYNCPVGSPMNPSEKCHVW